ncbi:hypothetical protein DFH05DRAFT_1399971 [Lentinula detonsa]|uniref:Uncharacterized protein n=1 Tax=Lentinula detonsa TaxID=2804962 RepID=A0A9W8NYW3_9AGAR|nr:hypothetical protein DFH05DRAFT_1399971 [Lentinula detonsa]
MAFLHRTPLKRKSPPVDDNGADPNVVAAVVLDDGDSGSGDGDAGEQDVVRHAPRQSRSPPPFPGRPGEYEAGRIDCPSCHKQVAFRDEETGEFSLKRWQQHWESWSPRNIVSSNGINVYRPGSDDLFPTMMAHPPAKRRRAKRTEDERIAYLRADPYVAQFEAYRVLCASCDKWIRLRPNSTYCSIPWDAHRKSCLSKKISNKNTYALDERNSLFSKDPDVRKFDAERVLCAVCDRWVPINPEDHLQAVQTWLNHRGECAKRAAAAAGVSGPGQNSGGSPRQHELRSSNVPPPPSHLHMSGRLPAPPAPSSPPPLTSAALSKKVHQLDTSVPSTEAGSQSEPIMYSPAAGIFPPGPANESRRRNAEQRAATLRADTLIKHVEPNRVFCSLCEKWVQLRQDSSFCAYPWFQHRGKCLARYRRRAQKAAEIEEIKKRRAIDDMAYFSGSDQGRSDEDDDMDVRFDYRGLSGSGSPASTGRSRSVASMASVDEGQAPGYITTEEAEYERPGLKRANKQNPSISHTRGQSSTPGTRPPAPTRHRAIAPRDTPLLIQPPRSRAELHTSQSQSRQTQPNHSLVLVSPQVLPGNSYHHYAANERPGPYRSSPHQRERVFVDSRGMNNSHTHSYEGKLSRENSHRVHRRYSQVEVRSHGPYGNGVLPSSATGPSSGRGVLADLDSPAGRKQFVSHSIAYLFQTTYDRSPCSSDELSISALVAYLNAAMPMDKHEDFDTAEVVRCVGALREKGKVLLEGDVVRKVRRDRD